MDAPPAQAPRRGRGPMLWVVAAILSTGCCVLMLPTVVLPAFLQGREAKRSSDCSHYLRQIGEVMGLYAADYDDKLPPADWMDASQRQMPRDKFLHCPSVGTADPDYGYALNGELVGRTRSTIPDASAPMVFDSTVKGRNAVGALDTLPRPGRHLGVNHLVTIDGSVVNVPDREKSQ